jgi:bifunctional non-homologous end joining protein LigD
MSSLHKYQRKRNFKRTDEPAGDATLEPAATGGSGGRFVIHKHAARNLHYDLRLEYGGVLKSWAVPKGPSLEPGEKRLAVEVEDHPLEYAEFEGVIPKGEYGGGTSMLWDTGYWQPLQRTGKTPKPTERLDFELEGEKLHGAWTLVRTQQRDRKNNQWLLIKRHDKGVESSNITELSVATGRTMEQIANQESTTATGRDGASESRSKGQQKAMPAAVKPVLATPAKEAPAGDNWLHEIKFDGYRVLARYDRGRVKLLTRNGHDWSARFPELKKRLETLACDKAILDGEVVASQADGTTSFRALQEALTAKKTGQLAYQAFDLLYLDGRDLTSLPLRERKQTLHELLTSSGLSADAKIRYTDHIVGKGPQFAEQACGLGLEGIISKGSDGRYRAGRSRDWLKVKCMSREDFVICGFTPPSGSRVGFGALLLGAWQSGDLVYTGRVGTGFSERLLRKLHSQLMGLQRKTSPLKHPPQELDEVQWVTPSLVAEVEFSNWTRDGLLRHASFRGLREDKVASDIKLAGAAAPDTPAQPKTRKPLKGTAQVAGVRLTHADRVLYPSQGTTKQALAEYYESIQDWILPYLEGRPLSLVRCPDGYGEECFYQKNPGQALSKLLKPERDFVVVRSLPDLIALVQVGALELHPWGSKVENLERPDQLVFDLDPAPAVGLPDVVRVARSLRDQLAELGLCSFLRTTGGKGFHLVVPVTPELSWNTVKAFCKGVAQQQAKADPKRVTAVMSKQKRKGRIFLDYLRNGRGATAIASYSPRARKGAPVAVPITWDELTPSFKPDRYTLDNVRRRLSALQRDPWSEFEASRRSVSEEAMRAVGVNAGDYDD